MDIDSVKNSGILHGMFSGIALGLAAFLMKIAVGSGILTLSFFLSPFTWTALVLALAGFYSMQKAFYSGFLSISVSIVAGLSIAVPVLLAAAFLNESLTSEAGGIVIILAGVAVLGFSNSMKKKSS